jgi:hypothetical protein
MWDVVSPTYLKMCEGSINSGFLMEPIDVILINLITKSVKTYLLGGWHPITLLNVSYQTLVKALARWIRLRICVYYLEVIGSNT